MMRLVILLSVAVILAIFSNANGAAAVANTGDFGAGAFAGPGIGAFAGPGMFPGFGNFPFPRFDFPVITPWYEGQNVCKDVRNLSDFSESELEDDDDLDLSNVQTGMSSESCSGNDRVYICKSTTSENGQTKTIVTKYKCCEGFVRPLNGEPGCVAKET